MELDFAKLHGLGNDFIMIDDFSREIELDEQTVRGLCDRHFGIGADGVILIRPSEHDECVAYMHYINADGSLAQMCGNGIRCFAKYLVDRGFVQASQGRFVADTLAGPRPIEFEVDDYEKLIMATVDMGRPELNPAAVPVDAQTDSLSASGVACVRGLMLDSPWGPFTFTCLSMGNPHAVCFIDNWDALPAELFTDPAHPSLETLDLGQVGAYFESHPVFPEHANIEFVSEQSEVLAMRVYERGCGETLACGTGACAVSVAACLNERSGRENEVSLRGGSLFIVWGEDDHVYMTGPARQSFTGKLVI